MCKSLNIIGNKTYHKQYAVSQLDVVKESLKMNRDSDSHWRLKPNIYLTEI